jgi:hypothetical protein
MDNPFDAKRQCHRQPRSSIDESLVDGPFDFRNLIVKVGLAGADRRRELMRPSQRSVACPRPVDMAPNTVTDVPSFPDIDRPIADVVEDIYIRFAREVVVGMGIEVRHPADPGISALSSTAPTSSFSARWLIAWSRASLVPGRGIGRAPRLDVVDLDGTNSGGCT